MGSSPECLHSRRGKHAPVRRAATAEYRVFVLSVVNFSFRNFLQSDFPEIRIGDLLRGAEPTMGVTWFRRDG